MPFTLYQHEKPSGKVWTAKAENWNKSLTHIEHPAGTVGRESLVN